MLIDDFINYIKAEKRYSAHTALNYGRDLERFVRDVCAAAGVPPEEFDPAAVTADDVRSWIIALSEGGLGPSTVNRMTSSVRSFYRWLRMKGVVVVDPMKRIGNQKTPSRLPVYIPESKIDLIDGDHHLLPGDESASDDYTARRNELMVLVFYSTGIRLAELHDIKLGDFSDDLRTLRVTGKGGKERVVPVVGHTASKIGEFTAQFNGGKICFTPEKNLFLNGRGEPMSRSSIYGVVRNYLTQAGVQGKKSPHVLRHTFATHLLNDGADMRDIQELLGHSSLAATQVYTHNSISRLKEVYKTSHPRGKKKDGDR